MEIYEFDYGWDRIRARLRKTGSVYVDLPVRFGERGALYNERIVLEERGWRFTSTQNDDIEYYFHVWLTDDGRLSWANDMSRGIQYIGERFDPDCPNAGLINDTASLLYTVSQEIRKYQKRNLPTHEVFELRKRYLDATLKMLGYDSIDAVGEKLDDTKGVLGLTRVVDGLEKYLDLSHVVYSLGKAGDEDMFKSRIKGDVTREQVLDFIKPVQEVVEEYESFLSTRDAGIEERKRVYPGYKSGMRSKVGEYSADEYEAKVKAVALLILELNADLLTEEQRVKLGIPLFEVRDDIAIKDKISNLIDSEEFNVACRVEDEFAYAESEELVKRVKAINVDGVPGEYGFTREDVVRILTSELQDLEERKSSVDNQEKIRRNYYTEGNKKPKGKKIDDDEYVY